MPEPAVMPEPIRWVSVARRRLATLGGLAALAVLPLAAIVWEHDAEERLDLLQGQDEMIDELQLRAVSAMGEGPLRLYAELTLRRDAAQVVEQVRPFVGDPVAEHLHHLVAAWPADEPGRRILGEIDGVVHAQVVHQHTVVRFARVLSILAGVVAGLGGVLGGVLATRRPKPVASESAAPGRGSDPARPSAMGSSRMTSHAGVASPTPLYSTQLPSLTPPPLPAIPPPNLSRRQGETPLPLSYERFTGRVLLVEDNPINQRVTRQQLQELGLDVEVAGDAETGLARLDHETFSVVLMDLQLPGIDGLTATRRLRASEESTGRPPVPVVAITANAAGSDREACFNAGMDGYLAKPARLNDLARALARYVQPAPDAVPTDATPEAHDAVVPAADAAPAAALSAPEPAAESMEPVMLHDPILWAKLRSETAQSDPRMLEELVADLRRDGPGQVADLWQGYSAGDWERVRSGSHRLKGSAGMLGLPQLSTAAKMVEAAAKISDGPAVQAGLLQLAVALEATFADPAVQALK